jgi:hypothetical protein
LIKLYVGFLEDLIKKALFFGNGLEVGTNGKLSLNTEVNDRIRVVVIFLTGRVLNDRVGSQNSVLSVTAAYAEVRRFSYDAN